MFAASMELHTAGLAGRAAENSAASIAGSFSPGEKARMRADAETKIQFVKQPSPAVSRFRPAPSAPTAASLRDASSKCGVRTSPAAATPPATQVWCRFPAQLASDIAAPRDGRAPRPFGLNRLASAGSRRGSPRTEEIPDFYRRPPAPN